MICHKILHQVFRSSCNMPKSKSGSKGKNGLDVSQAKSIVTSEDNPSVTVNKSGDILLSVQARPGAKISAIIEMTLEGLFIHIAAPAQEGEANAELTRFLSQVLQVRKSDVSIAKGGKSRQKVIAVSSSSDLSVSEVVKRLQQCIQDR